MTAGPPPGPPRLRARLTLATRVLELEAFPGAVVTLVDVDADEAVAALAGRRGRQRVVVDGRRLRGRSLARRVRRGMAFVVEPAVAADVSVLDHLAARGGTRRARRLLDSSPLLRGRGDDPAGVLSGGERRVLAWLGCIAAAPAVVVVDGGATGLDADTVAWLDVQVRDLRRTGTAFVVRPRRPEEAAWAAPL